MIDLSTYFLAEKQAGGLIAILGLLAVGFSAWLWATHHPFRSMAWPLVLLALVQIAVGVGLVLKTPAQVAALEQAVAEDSGSMAHQELARMNKVNRTFIVLKVAEVALLVISLVLIWRFTGRSPLWTGVGMGLLLQAALMLVFDLFAERRALEYVRWLQDLPSP